MLVRRAIYSAKETALMLGLSEQILMREFKSGIIEGSLIKKKKGRGNRMCIRFSKKDIEDYIERQRIDYSKKPGGNDSP
jgi:hypothetical protein